MTQQDRREYEWETGQVLLNDDATATDLIRHNNNVQAVASRSRDEAIDRMVRELAEKTNINQDLTGNFKPAQRGCGRVYPPRLRNAAVQFLMAKYEE